MAETDPFDPFASNDEADRTMIKPNPGLRLDSSSVGGVGSRSAPRGPALDLSRLGGMNPLVSAANALLVLVPQLRSTTMHADLDALRANLVAGVKAFENRAHANHVPAEAVTAARYCLCTLLDETAANTPWGGGGAWSGRSLLVSFHSEAWGGEKFFALLDRVSDDPRRNIDLIELMYVCLAFGFQGRYRVAEGGRERLSELREKVYQTIRAVRGDYERDLSPFWKGVTDRRSPLLRIVPLWVAAAVAGVVLLGVYLVFSWRLDRQSDPAFKTLASIPGTMPITAPAPVETPRLSLFLQPEIAQQLVSVQETLTQSKVTIHGDGVFASGSASVAAGYIGLMNRIADALKTVSGRVLVTGHTDDRRIVSLRFSSNWDLSRARAAEVVRLLVERGNAAARFSTEGRGDAEPLVANDTAQNRARNRRVEIVVYIDRAIGAASSAANAAPSIPAAKP